jgi:hypothetical protein
MANNISTVYVEGFDRNVRQLAQQMSTRLLPYVDIRASSAAAENWETLAPSDWDVKVGRGAATPVQDVVWGRRQSGNATYDNGEVVGADDITQMLADPNSNIARNFAMGGARSQDTAIITAATGAASDGDGGTDAFLTGQIVDAGWGSQISFDAVTNVAELFLEADIDPSVRKLAVVGPAQMRKLLQTVEATSRDYAEKALQSGFVANWMGMDWIVSTLLEAGGGAGTTDCFFMTEAALGLQMNADISTQIQKDPSRSFDWSLYSCWQGGAVRVQDKQIVWGQFLD